MNQLNAILAIAYRDFRKFAKDRGRIMATFLFPIIFIGILGTSLQTSFGQFSGFNFLTFVFTGIFAQTIFQSAASGIISLIEDRETDFSQEMFISPISRYSIIVGKIIGESSIAITQGIGIILFGFIIGINLTLPQLISLLPVAIVIAIFGGAFGLLVLSNLSSQRLANQIFPFIIFPQFFLSGVFSPVKDLPSYLLILSRIAPMTYAVDFVRSIFYIGQPEYSKVVLYNPLLDLLVIGIIFIAFIIVGTYLFVRNEKNR